MAKKKSSGKVTVQFRSPTFIHKRVKYVSKEVEAAAKAGDEAAQQIIAELVQIGSGVIVVTEVKEPAAPENPPATPPVGDEVEKEKGTSKRGKSKKGKEAPDA